MKKTTDDLDPPHERRAKRDRDTEAEEILPASNRGSVEKISQKLEAKLNRRFMQILNYQTPKEMLAAHRKRKKRLRALRKSGVRIEG